LIEQKGAWFVWGDEKFHGKQQVLDYFMENGEEYGALTNMMEEIAADEIIKRITTGEFTPESDEDDEDELQEEDVL